MSEITTIWLDLAKNFHAPGADDAGRAVLYEGAISVFRSWEFLIRQRA